MFASHGWNLLDATTELKDQNGLKLVRCSELGARFIDIVTRTDVAALTL